jgi:hypothetical protein
MNVLLAKSWNLENRLRLGKSKLTGKRRLRKNVSPTSRFGKTTDLEICCTNKKGQPVKTDPIPMRKMHMGL